MKGGYEAQLTLITNDYLACRTSSYKQSVWFGDDLPKFLKDSNLPNKLQVRDEIYKITLNLK